MIDGERTLTSCSLCVAELTARLAETSVAQQMAAQMAEIQRSGAKRWAVKGAQYSY